MTMVGVLKPGHPAEEGFLSTVQIVVVQAVQAGNLRQDCVPE